MCIRDRPCTTYDSRKQHRIGSPAAASPRFSAIWTRICWTGSPSRGRRLRSRAAAHFVLLNRAHGRKEDHLSDVLAVREQHHETVDTDAQTAGRRQPVFEGMDCLLYTSDAADDLTRVDL